MYSRITPAISPEVSLRLLGFSVIHKSKFHSEIFPVISLDPHILRNFTNDFSRKILPLMPLKISM